MRAMSRALWTGLVAASLLGSAFCAGPPEPEPEAETVAGRWDAVVVANDVDVPFPFEITIDGASVRGSFFNGERRITSTEGSLVDNELKLTFGQYGSTLQATYSDGALTGEYIRTRGAYPFRASRAPAGNVASESAPSIDGTWIATANSNKGEDAWRFIARQNGAEVEGTILRVDGDTGTLQGAFRDGRFVLSHFSGARPLRVEVTPLDDGTLELQLNGKTELRAVRADTAAAADIGTPTDPAYHTSVRDPSEPFQFAFPNLEGQIVSSTDERFQGKVVLVNITGSWCPNCHDEAPFLAALYNELQDRGFEIVALSFERGAQLENPEQLRTFIDTYDLEYTVLLAGEPDDVAELIPQAVNLNAFPTSFILGRDGRVRAVHAGFPSPGSGEYYEQAEREITELVESLLAEGLTSD